MIIWFRFFYHSVGFLYNQTMGSLNSLYMKMLLVLFINCNGAWVIEATSFILLFNLKDKLFKAGHKLFKNMSPKILL